METNLTAKRVGAEVRAAMARREKSQGDLAQFLGKSQAFVSRRLRGELAFDIAELEEISDWLAVPLIDLLGDRAAS